MTENIENTKTENIVSEIVVDFVHSLSNAVCKTSTQGTCSWDMSEDKVVLGAKPCSHHRQQARKILHLQGVNEKLVQLSKAMLELQIENNRLLKLFAQLGFCPNHGESMPCFKCGAGL